MKKIKDHFILQSCLLLLMSGFLHLEAEDNSLSLGDEPPAFTYFNSAGDKIRLSKYLGEKPVVIAFFATYCDACKKELPFLQKQSQGGSIFELIIIASDTGDEASVKKYLKNIGVQAAYIYDPKEEILKKFHVTKLPLSIFIGKSGKIVAIETGYKVEKSAEIAASIAALGEK